MEMYISILMDRPIDKDLHYISPGGFAFDFGGKVIAFDFVCYAGSINQENPRLVDFVMMDLDISSFPDAKILNNKEALEDIRGIDECFVYTGEYNEPEIHPERINYIKFELDGEFYPVPECVLREYNITLAGDLRKMKEIENMESLPQQDSFKFFYSYEYESAKAFAIENNYHMIWGSDNQGLNGDTYVVYNRADNLPQYLRNYALSEEARGADKLQINEEAAPVKKRGR